MIDRDKAIQMAKEAGFTTRKHPGNNERIVAIHSNGSWIDLDSKMQTLLNRVRNEALEEAAVLCDKLSENGKYPDDVNGWGCAAAIRVRLKDKS